MVNDISVLSPLSLLTDAVGYNCEIIFHKTKQVVLPTVPLNICEFLIHGTKLYGRSWWE
jgi:hypothetical protein